MTLKQQVILIIFSIFFGIFFSLFTDFNNKIIRNKKSKNRLLFTLLFSLINALIYFSGLQNMLRFLNNCDSMIKHFQTFKYFKNNSMANRQLISMFEQFNKKQGSVCL